MPISNPDRLAAVLDSLTTADLDAVPPARLRQLAASMRHWGAIADQRADRRLGKQQESGVLRDLRKGRRAE